MMNVVTDGFEGAELASQPASLQSQTS